MNKIINVGLVQMYSTASAGDNLTRAAQHVRLLAQRGAKIVALPELFLTPYFCQTRDKKFFDLAEPVPGPTVRVLQAIAKKNRVVLTTSLYERAGGKYYNTAVVIDADGKYLGKYRKMHIPDDPKFYYGEAYYFSPGNLGVPVFKTRYGKIATLICWDQWFPEGARLAAAKGAEIIFYPTAIGFQLKARPGINEAEHQAWQTIQQSHAIANGVFVAAVNRVGLDNHLRFWGTSFVADPYGRVLKQGSVNREEDILVACDLNLVPQMRRDWPFLAARRLKVEQ
ncbi:MAG: carbon-nitrogen hydrolase [Patescibacteria group bacterium]|nr:carbon-nitrogen hydrolase [Patescibacteria group bacterium]